MHHRPILGTQLCANPAQAVARLLHESYGNDDARSMATAMLTLSLWQKTRGPVTDSVPSVLLVHASEKEGDPIDAFVSAFLHNSVRSKEEELKEQEESGFKPTLNCPSEPQSSMRAALLLAEDSRRSGNTRNFAFACKSFNNYRSQYHGHGSIFRYTRAWSDEYGWLGCDENRMILRLDQSDDLIALRKDLLEKPTKLSDPRGLDYSLFMVSKKLALSGSIPGSEWDRPLVDALMKDGAPVLFLPHTITEPLNIPYGPDLGLGCMQVENAGRLRQVTAQRVLWDDARIQHFYRVLMRRLAHTTMDYSFNVQRVIRELGDVCVNIAAAICINGGGAHAISMISQDLFRSTLRAVVIGVSSLTYHGWGFCVGIPRASILQLLQLLRTHGPQTRRNLQRKFPQWLKAGRRDALLDQLSDEGLVRCPGNIVSAVPLSEFIKWLSIQPEFPEEGCLSSLLLEKKCRPEGPLPGPPMKKKRNRKPRVAAKTSDKS